MTDVRFTLVGGPTVLVEAAGWTVLVDPTFDPAGRTYRFGWGTSSTKTAGPAVPLDDLPPVDAVLLTHDQHADNLDDAGRALLADVGHVLTTPAAARRMRDAPGTAVTGLDAWDAHVLTHPDRPDLHVTATPGRHGPPGARTLVGQVTGFALTWEGQAHGALWFSGDTVLHRRLRDVPRRLDVGTAVLHLGAVRFPSTGPVRFTMTAQEGARLAGLLDARTVLPVHVDDWSHFREPRSAAQAVLDASPVRERVRWLDRGAATAVEV